MFIVKYTATLLKSRNAGGMNQHYRLGLKKVAVKRIDMKDVDRRSLRQIDNSLGVTLPKNWVDEILESNELDVQSTEFRIIVEETEDGKIRFTAEVIESDD